MIEVESPENRRKKLRRFRERYGREMLPRHARTVAGITLTALDVLGRTGSVKSGMREVLRQPHSGVTARLQ